MKTIFKTKLAVCDSQTVKLPVGFQILHIGLQKGVPCIWYECDSDSPLVCLTVYCIGTGFDMDGLPRSAEYIGTIQLGGFVGHYYIDSMYREKSAQS